MCRSWRRKCRSADHSHPARRLSGSGETDQIALRVREMRDHEIFPRVLHWANHARPAEALGLLERDFDVGNANVEDRMAVVAWASTNAARNPHPVVSRVKVHEPVITSLRDGLRHRGARVEFPPEQIAVVAPELLRILPDNLEMHDRLSHGYSFPLGS